MATDIRFQNPRFWGPAQDRRGGSVDYGYKMKWHNFGNGNVQLRLCVALVGDDAFLCHAFVKTDASLDRRMAAKLKDRILLIREGKHIEKGGAAVTDAQDNLKHIAVEMMAAGLPMPFVLRAFELAGASEGVEDLVHLWAEATDPRERGEVEADLQEAIEDREASGPPNPVTTSDEVEHLLDERRAWKARLRALVESRGGVSQVARRAGIPQPSLSRLLNTMSEPRPATLLRLAESLGVPIEEVMHPPRRRIVRKARPLVLPTVPDAIRSLAGTIRYGHGRKRKVA